MAAKFLPPPIITMAVLGIVSGFLSSFELPVIGQISIFNASIQQGLLFGLVIAIGLYFWGRSGWAGALLAIPVTLAAWVAGFNSYTFLTGGVLNDYLAGMAAGAVGATLTILGGALTAPALRRPIAWIMTIAIGAIFGILIALPDWNVEENLYILFVPWQAMVAASIGAALHIGRAGN